MTTITLPRAVVEQALEALEWSWGGEPMGTLERYAITALRAALAQEHDPVAHSGWVLREVLFDNGEPIGHREPQHSPAALAQEPASDFERGFQRGWQRAMRDRDRDAVVRAKVEAELAATVERLAEPSPIRELLTQAAAMAVAAERAGKYEGASWVADAVLEAAPQPQQAEAVATVTECEACFTPDVCQLRGRCDYYTASQMRIAAPPQQAEPVAWWYKGESWFDGYRWHDSYEVTKHERVAKRTDQNAKPLYFSPHQGNNHD